MKKHWTQTAAGRKRMKEAMTKSWEKRKFKKRWDAIKIPDITEPVLHGSRLGPVTVTSSGGQGITATYALQPVNGTLSSRVKAANTLSELEEIKAFLDLRDELLARLP